MYVCKTVLRAIWLPPTLSNDYTPVQQSIESCLGSFPPAFVSLIPPTGLILDVPSNHYIYFPEILRVNLFGQIMGPQNSSAQNVSDPPSPQLAAPALPPKRRSTLSNPNNPSLSSIYSTATPSSTTTQQVPTTNPNPNTTTTSVNPTTHHPAPLPESIASTISSHANTLTQHAAALTLHHEQLNTILSQPTPPQVMLQTNVNNALASQTQAIDALSHTIATHLTYLYLLTNSNPHPQLPPLPPIPEELSHLFTSEPPECSPFKVPRTESLPINELMGAIIRKSPTPSLMITLFTPQQVLPPSLRKHLKLAARHLPNPRKGPLLRTPVFKKHHTRHNTAEPVSQALSLASFMCEKFQSLTNINIKNIFNHYFPYATSLHDFPHGTYSPILPRPIAQIIIITLNTRKRYYHSPFDNATTIHDLLLKFLPSYHLPLNLRLTHCHAAISLDKPINSFIDPIVEIDILLPIIGGSKSAKLPTPPSQTPREPTKPHRGPKLHKPLTRPGFTIRVATLNCNGCL